jgi:hypothetical protein
MKHRMTEERLDLLVKWLMKGSDFQLWKLEKSENWEAAEAFEKERNAILAIVLDKWRKENP